jgi:hypothetical protein
MNKKFIWVLGILCAVFSTQSFARETSSFDQTKKRYEAVSGERAEKIFMEMLYKDFFFPPCCRSMQHGIGKFLFG